MIKLSDLKIRVISLKDSTRRLSFARKMQDKINYTFFDAKGPADIKDFQEYFLHSDIYMYADEYNIDSVIACANSHYELWKEVLTNNEPLLILEDDAIFMDDKAEKLFRDGVINKEFDVFFLDGKLVEEDYYIRSPYAHHSGVAYIMTPSGAKKLIEKIEREGFGAALDWEMVNMQNHGLMCFSFNRVVLVPDASEKSQLRSLDSRNDLPRLLKHLGLNNVGAEIGVATGDFSEILIREGDFSKFYSIDSWEEKIPDVFNADGSNVVNTWAESNLQMATKKLEKFGDRSIIIKNLSHIAAEEFPDEYFDFVYLDADHREESVELDIKTWYPKVRRGGMLAGHDYLDEKYVTTNQLEYKDGKVVWENGQYSLFGVKTVVDKFVKDNDLNLIIIEEKQWEPWHSWAFIKK